jgi:hypothetical protein
LPGTFRYFARIPLPLHPVFIFMDAVGTILVLKANEFSYRPTLIFLGFPSPIRSAGMVSRRLFKPAPKASDRIGPNSPEDCFLQIYLF